VFAVLLIPLAFMGFKAARFVRDQRQNAAEDPAIIEGEFTEVDKKAP
jgi:hypothetical protein